MAHVWEKKRPVSAWLPGGYSQRNKGKTSRISRPVHEADKCIECDFCWIFCPEGCIDRKAGYRIDYDFCKGCGICATECPKEAMTMEREKQA